MQATVRTNSRSGFDRIKTVLVAAAILASTIAGLATLTLTQDTDGVSPARFAAPAHNDRTTWRFAEINELPVGSVARVDGAHIRFLEMNQLPGDELVAPEVIPGARS